MLGLRRMIRNGTLKKLQFAATTLRMPSQVAIRTFAKASSMTFDDIAAEFSAANNLLDVQKISVDLYSDYDFLGRLSMSHVGVTYLHAN